MDLYDSEVLVTALVVEHVVFSHPGDPGIRIIGQKRSPDRPVYRKFIHKVLRAYGVSLSMTYNAAFIYFGVILD